jgi:hypothetical protein
MTAEGTVGAPTCLPCTEEPNGPKHKIQIVQITHYILLCVSGNPNYDRKRPFCFLLPPPPSPARPSTLFCYLLKIPLTKGRITQQSSPEPDESNAFSKKVFLASTEDNNLGTEPKFELIWSNG